MNQPLLFKYQNNSLFHSITDNFIKIVRDHNVTVAELGQALEMASEILKRESEVKAAEAIMYKEFQDSMSLALKGYVGKVLDEKVVAEIEATVIDAITNNAFEGADNDPRT